MTQHLTTVPLEGNNLASRMSLTMAGQITWVDLSKRQTCTACKFYQDGKVTQGKSKGFGRCALVKAHTRKPGALFDGPRARACTKFEGRQ